MIFKNLLSLFLWFYVLILDFDDKTYCFSFKQECSEVQSYDLVLRTSTFRFLLFSKKTQEIEEHSRFPLEKE